MDPVDKWRKICSVREQFILLLWLQKTNLKQTVELENEYTFTEYDNSSLDYSLHLSHASCYITPYGLDTYCT